MKSPLESTAPAASNKTRTGMERFLSFSLQGDDYAVPLLMVKEVIALPEITPVPQTPTYFLGIMNLRGQIISVIDLRMKFGFKPERNEQTCIIICDFPGASLGVVVSSVNHVLSLSKEEIGKKPELQGHPGANYILGVAKKEDKLVLLIDISGVLGVEDQAAMLKGNVG